MSETEEAEINVIWHRFWFRSLGVASSEDKSENPLSVSQRLVILIRLIPTVVETVTTLMRKIVGYASSHLNRND